MGQRAEFTQFWASPLHLNPALAGISHGPRVAMNYRNQWPELGAGPNGGFVSYAVSYDQHVEAIRGGLGVLFVSDRIANDILVQNRLSAMYSFQARISDRFALKFGVEGSYSHRYVDWYEMLVSDQIDPFTGFFQSVGVPNPTAEPPPGDFDRHRGNASVGVLAFSNKYYGGVSIHNLVPERDFYGDETSVLGVTVHGGAVFTFGKGYRQKGFVSPSAMYAFQNSFNQITLGSMIGYDLFYTGIWLRHTIENFDAVISGVGIKKGVLRFGYTFDVNVSPLRGTAGSHEFSFVFNFTKEDNSLNPSYRQGVMPCPYVLDF